MNILNKLATIAALVIAMGTAGQATAAEALGGVESNGSGTAVAVGFHWDHCSQTYRALGSSRTWCYAERLKTWVWTTDDQAEEMLIACAASYHWCGFNFTTTTSWNNMRIWKS